MANQFELVLQKNYEELQLRGRSGCYFVDVDDEGRFRSLVEKFCREHSIDNAVRLQILPSNLSDPLILIVSILKKIAETFYKGDAEEYFANYREDHPETAGIIELFTGSAGEELEFPLKDEIRYKQRLYQSTFTKIFYELVKGSDSPVIFVSGFQYASYSFLSFFTEFIKSEQNDRNFLIFSSFCSSKRPKIKNGKNLWTKWIWELECNGKLLHCDLNDERVLPSAVWPSHEPDRELGVNVTVSLDKAEELINHVCFNEALQLLYRIYDLVNENYEPSIRIRMNLLLGRAQLFSGFNEEALISFDRLNDIAQKLNDERNLCISNMELAYTHVFRGDYLTAQRYATYALKYAQSLAGNLPIKAQFCEFVTMDLAAVPYPLESMQKLLLDLQINDLYRERTYVLSKLFSQEPFYPTVFTPTVCLNFVNESIDLARQHNLRLLLAGAYHGKGVIYVKLEQIDNAIKCFLESEEIRIGLDIPSELAKIKNGIGYLYCVKENFEKSHAYYLDAMRTVINLCDLAEISSSLFNLAWLYFQIGEFQGVLSVLKTLSEILKVKNTKYFPFRNLHDVFLLQGLAYFSQGMYVHAGQMIENSLNLDIPVSFQGSLLRPILRALIVKVYHEKEKTERFLAEADEAWHQTRGQLSPLHDILLMRCHIYIYRCWNEPEKAYRELKTAVAFCKEHNYILALDALTLAWTRQAIPQFSDINFAVPKVELTEILFIISQERNVKNLRQQVYGMRLCSLLQQMTTRSDDLAFISSETLRLLCMHYNVQAGLVYVEREERKNSSGGNVEVIATYNQLKNFMIDYPNLESFIRENRNKPELVYRKVKIKDQEFSSVLLLPLLDSKKLLGHIVLTTNIGDFDVDDNQLDTLRFVANLLASKVVNINQREQLIKLSTRDQLTGLRNRQYFQSRLSKVRHLSSCCLAFIDLDNFKYYNDTFGHDVGDQLLIWFSELLTSVENRKIKVCRWGGDEFLILFSDVPRTEVMQIMQSLRLRLEAKNGFVVELTKLLNRPIMLPRKFYLDFSAGVCVAENMEESIDPAVLLKKADDSLYLVKRTGKAQIVSCGYLNDI